MKKLHCSFCGRPKTEVEFLFKGSKANICNDCVAIVSAILEDIRGGTTQKRQGETGIDIGTYKLDYRLANLLQKETLLKFHCVPLDVYKDRIILALIDPSLISAVTNELKKVLKNEPDYRNRKLELNIFLATESSVKRKIQDFTLWHDQQRA